MTIEVIQTAHAGYPQNNWFPYLTLADCEALCQASPTCVTATYEFDKDRISLETFPTYHGTCSLNSGTPTVILRQNMHEPTRMTIIKRDSGMFDWSIQKFKIWLKLKLIFSSFWTWGWNFLLYVTGGKYQECSKWSKWRWVWHHNKTGIRDACSTTDCCPMSSIVVPIQISLSPLQPKACFTFTFNGTRDSFSSTDTTSENKQKRKLKN